jgi:hypothetical protein
MGLLYDQLNSFGKITAAGVFPDTINLGPNSSVGRMTVDFHANLSSGASIVFSILMAPDNSGAPGTWVTVATSETLTFTDLKTQVYQLPVPATIPKYKYQHIQAKETGTITGTIEAVLNTYVGK